MRNSRNRVFIKYLASLVLGVAIGVNYHGEINSFILQHLEDAGYKVLPSYRDDDGTVRGLKDDGLANESYTNNHDSHLSDSESSDSRSSYAPEIFPCFTPPANCLQPIIDVINKATGSIYVQAYGLSHPQIIAALVNAKDRGVEVRVLLDRSNLTQKYSGLNQLKEAGIETTIDMVPGIAHNKIMIIDHLITVTGSFNFTKSAATRNAENLLIIEDKAIAEKYLRNWLYRKSLNKRTSR